MHSIAKDGKTRSFDQGANGFVLSDAANVIFLQKAEDALRIYADLVHVKDEFIAFKEKSDGLKSGFYRNPQETISFLEDFYEEAQLSPHAVDYVEAIGAGTRESDKSELEALDNVFCTNRAKPLFVGSVVSNIGFTVAASGLTSIIKVLLGYHTGLLAGNLHYSTPREDITAVKDGQICILGDHRTIEGDYAAVNGFSVTGINAHVLLKGNRKQKDLSKYKSSIAYLVTISGRQESSVNKIIDDLKTRPLDPEEIMLFHNIHSMAIRGHLSRGYIILDTKDNKTIELRQAVDYFDNAKRPLWFVFSGMGSQWAGMGTELMNIPIFSAAIERCQRALDTKGIDVVEIITSNNPDIFNNILNAFVGIAAIQIGLTDILTAMELTPDFIIGHSVGELGCAYADGCLTAEEVILAAYARGIASIETSLIKGSMAAVGIGFKQILPQCPPEIDVACHNGPDSCTISGPSDVVAQFVEQLVAKGVFAKTVHTANIAYHSRYIADAGPNLCKMLKTVIQNPRPRSNRWVSTSVPQENWNSSVARYCSAEYQTNNLLNPVLFEETCRLIPNNAILIEIAPHGLLQAILKRSLSPNCYNISLCAKGSEIILHLLQSVGKLYMEGCTPNLKALYPTVELPVSAGTPMLSHLVEWMHLKEWYMPSLYDEDIVCAVCEHLTSIHDEEHSYLRGTICNGKMIYPIGGLLLIVWDTLSMSMLLPKRQYSVKFTNVHIEVQPALSEERLLKLRVSINKGSGHFEITNDGSKVAAGFVFLVKQNKKVIKEEDTAMMLNEDNVYQLLQEKGYTNRDEFRLIRYANSSLTKAKIEWRDNLVALIENMLQLKILKENYDGVSQISHILEININTTILAQHTLTRDGKTVLLNVNLSITCNFVECADIHIKGIQTRKIPANSYCMKLLVPSSEDKSILVGLQRPTCLHSDVMLRSAEMGNINSLHWAEISEPAAPGILVKVHYASLSYYDNQKASGTELHENIENYYGMDFSGVTESGSRVMGIVRQGACRSYLRAHPDLLWPVPDHWTLEDAATVPLAYAYAFYCLAIKTQIHSGMSVFINEGASALGQAVIAICLALKCQVFTTVGDVNTKKFLKKLYPELKDKDIGYSRDVSLSDNILSATGGKGCNIVISNSQSSLKNTIIKCCGANGIIFDTEQISNRDNFEFCLNDLKKSKSYLTIDILTSFEDSSFEAIKQLMHDGISQGYVRPLARVTYDSHQVLRAFHLLTKNWHRGHVVLQLTHSVSPTQPRITCSAELSQLIICSDDIFVIRLAKRLVSRGSKFVHIYCPKLTWYLQHETQKMKDLGLDVILTPHNLQNMDEITSLLKKTTSIKPLESIFLANFENKDEISTNLFGKKISELFKDICPTLKYFTVITNSQTIESKSNATAMENFFVSQIYVPQLHLDGNKITKTVSNQAYWNAVLDALESAIRYALPLLVLQADETLSLLQQVSVLADVPSLKDASNTTTLEDLGVEYDKAKRIKEFLQKNYHVYLPEQEILGLNKIKLNKLDIFNENFVNNRGLDTYISSIVKDELNSETLIYSVPTLSSGKTVEQIGVVESEYLCIIPGIEGNRKRYRGLCERLKLPAMVLQPGLDMSSETIQESARQYCKILIDTLGIKHTFYLLGNDIGILIIMEMAAILEKNGFLGTIFCLGSTPEDVKLILEEQLATFATEDDLQLGVLKHVFKLLTGVEPTDLDVFNTLNSSWNEKIDVCIKAMMGRTTQTSQYAKALIQFVYARILSIKRYDSSVLPTLKSRVVVLRSPECTLSSALTSYFIEDLTAFLPDAANDLRCSAIINKNLSSEILKKFNKKNLCEKIVMKSMKRN